MTEFVIPQNSFSQGELGPYMNERAELDLYHSAAQAIENFVVLPHGGLMRRPGFGLVNTIATANADQTALIVFDFNRTQQYPLVFVDQSVDIYRDGAKVATVATPFLGSELADLRFTQSGDTMILVHPSHAPQKLERLGADAAWRLSTVVFANLPWFRYEQFSSATPSATTGTITVTLASGGGFFNAGHAGGAILRVNTGSVVCNNFPTDTAGGTAASSAGTAANAFDSTAGTTCATGAGGWAGYQFAATQTVRIVGVNVDVSGSYNLIFETAATTAFASPVNVGSTGPVTLTAGTIIYFDVPTPTSAVAFRVREATAAFTVRDVYFNFGLRITGTVGATLGATTADTTWSEQGWNPGRGFPRTATFHENRLVFGGTRDAPETLFGSKTGDFFNFDDGTPLGSSTITVKDDSAFKFTLSTDEVHIIRDLKSQRDLEIFTNQGEHSMSGNGAALTPTNVSVKLQSRYGCSRVRVVEVDGELIFSSANLKEIRSFIYQFQTDRYVSDNKTQVAHHLFQDSKYPLDMAYLRSYKDTQSNFMFIPRQDGQMAVLSINTARQVLAWSRFTTQGSFKRVAVAVADLNGSGPIERLYAIVQRANNVTLEMWTEAAQYVDCCFAGTNGSPQTVWTTSPPTPLANQVVQVVGDGLVLANQTMSGGGVLTLPVAVSSVVFGLGYTSTVETMKFNISQNGQSTRGSRIGLRQAVVGLLNSQSLKVAGFTVPFRSLGSSLLDQPLPMFSGTKKIRLGGIADDQNITCTVVEPLPCILLHITTKLQVRGDLNGPAPP